jgi:hypothetical protein
MNNDFTPHCDGNKYACMHNGVLEQKRILLHMLYKKIL